MLFPLRECRKGNGLVVFLFQRPSKRASIVHHAHSPHRHRPGHHVDASDRVRCRAQARRQRRRGAYPDLSGAGRGRARSGGDLGGGGRDRARRDGEGERRGEGRRRHRHHQSARDHDRVGPRDRQADPQRHRLAGPAHRAALRAAKADGHEAAIAAKTGLLCDPYFSGTKIAWLLDRVEGARAAARAGRLAFGTVDTFLLWRLTGGTVHATDVTNASRTLLFDIRRGSWDEELGRPAEVFRKSCCPGRRERGGLRLHDARAVRRRRSASSAWRATSRPQPSGRAAFSGNDEGDLRHRLLCAAEHRRAGRGVAPPAAHDHRLSD